VTLSAYAAAFLALFAVLELCARRRVLGPEATRKLLHTGSGLMTLSFPYVFHTVQPVLLLTASTAAFLAVVGFVRPRGARLAGVTTGVGRVSFGELYFPLSVAVLFWLTHGHDPLLFVIPILVLTLADATGAIVGARYGLTPYTGSSKSLEGSVAFAIVAFFCIHVPLVAWSSVGRVESLLMAATLALLVMLLEGSAWRGLDNLFIPIGGYLLLRAYIGLDAPALAARLAVTAGLVALIVLYRMRTTLEDDSLVAGAFFCYVAWATMGWQWLVPPLAVLAGHSRLSPSTAENSRRMHGLRALLSIWLIASAWLALARLTGTPELLFPYTVVFAAHLAMFGLSRLAHQFPNRTLGPLFWRAVGASWAIVMGPFVLVSGPGAAVPSAIAAGASMALGTLGFAASQPVRNAPQTMTRWLCQGTAAAVTSVLAWVIA
jgi:phytol kinase